MFQFKVCHENICISRSTNCGHCASLYLRVMYTVEYKVIQCKNVVITLVLVVFFEQLSNDLFTADIPSAFGIFVYNDLTSIVTR